MQPTRNLQDEDPDPGPGSHSSSNYQSGHPSTMASYAIQQAFQDARSERYAPRDGYPYGGYPPDGLGQRTRDVEMLANGRATSYNCTYKSFGWVVAVGSLYHSNAEAISLVAIVPDRLQHESLVAPRNLAEDSRYPTGLPIPSEGYFSKPSLSSYQPPERDSYLRDVWHSRAPYAQAAAPALEYPSVGLFPLISDICAKRLTHPLFCCHYQPDTFVRSPNLPIDGASSSGRGASIAELTQALRPSALPAISSYHASVARPYIPPSLSVATSPLSAQGYAYDGPIASSYSESLTLPYRPTFSADSGFDRQVQSNRSRHPPSPSELEYAGVDSNSRLTREEVRMNGYKRPRLDSAKSSTDRVSATTEASTPVSQGDDHANRCRGHSARRRSSATANRKTNGKCSSATSIGATGLAFCVEARSTDGT